MARTPAQVPPSPSGLPSRRDRPLAIAVLCGGPSIERPVSRDSGREVAAALVRRGHRIETIDPGAVAPTPDEFTRLADWRTFDAAFLALHGTFGEDGTVQRLLDAIGLPYTGSAAEASQVAFQKSAAKERFAAEGVATPEHVVVHESETPARLAAVAASLGYPLVVKPDAQGSSFGVSVVRSPAKLPAALAGSFSLGSYGLLERYVPGTEWTVGFLGDRPLPPLCVSTPREFLDFEAKYRDEATAVSFGESLPPETVARIATAADAARRAVGAGGLCRIDVRLDPDLVPWVLEVNTLPGLTPHSAAPTAAARIGMSFDDLCEAAVRLALARPAVRRAA